jgi:hypothetical protein
MSVLKQPLATPSRIRGIFRYLLQTKGLREKREVLERILSPNELVKNKSSPRPMFNYSIAESLKCGLLVEEDKEDYKEIAINPNLPEETRNPKLGDKLLSNTLADLLFASDNEDEEDFGFVCAWYLAQDIYDPPGTWEDVEQQVSKQRVGELLKMSNNTLYGQMDDWMCYMGLAWGHALGGKRFTVPDPTVYIKRNLKDLFQGQVGKKVLLREFIERLANKCPLFETGKFRETIEANIGRRQPNYLSTSTAFALFRLQEEGHIRLERESDADLMILPKANNQVDDDGRKSHIIYCEGES